MTAFSHRAGVLLEKAERNFITSRSRMYVYLNGLFGSSTNIFGVISCDRMKLISDVA